VADQDVIYVGGGNTASMPGVWRAHGLDRLLARALERGAVLTGVSAGKNCWFESSVTDSFGRVERGEAGVVETPVATRYLGA
jgi:dipeptidase E